jgi:copper homeostasis protein (lipoprotein)
MRKRSSRAKMSLALAGVIGLQVALAASAQPKQPPRTIEIGEFAQQVRVSLKVGDTLRVVLSSTPSTGYSWHVAGNIAVLKATASSNISAAQKNIGAAERQALVFTATAAGHGDLILEYSRSWEKGKPAARQYMIAVTVGNAAAHGGASPVQIAGGVPQGTYSGKLPCADCSGLLTSIAFYAEGSTQSPAGYYVRTSTYLGAPKGNVVSIDAGHYLLQKGTPDKPDWTVFTLQSNTSDSLESYLLQGDSLVPLGSDGKPIQAPFNMSLKKQP